MSGYTKWQKAGNARHYTKPYWRLYKALLRNARNRMHKVTLTYERYKKIIADNPTCHYCNTKLRWVKHGLRATMVNLDRKNNKSGYNAKNVVASCWRCNHARYVSFTYKDWYAMTKHLRDKKAIRKNHSK